LKHLIEKKLKSTNLVKKFDSRIVVDDVTFEVNKGEIVGLLGPNGAGKTTSFYMTVGLLTPNSGEVSLGEKNITKLPIHKRARLGLAYLPQNASIFRKLSVEDNLLAVMEVWGTPHAMRNEELNKLLDQFGLQHIRKSLGISLSGGERRRVEIARALVINPEFLLLDEPFAGIDPVTVGEIQNLISKLVDENDLGVLITDHNVRETLGVCQRAYILAAGKILAEGTPNEVASLDSVKQAYLGENFVF
jgi:lipopolysaccharide export system ATP-binding protein